MGARGRLAPRQCSTSSPRPAVPLGIAGASCHLSREQEHPPNPTEPAGATPGSQRWGQPFLPLPQDSALLYAGVARSVLPTPGQRQAVLLAGSPPGTQRCQSLQPRCGVCAVGRILPAPPPRCHVQYPSLAQPRFTSREAVSSLVPAVGLQPGPGGAWSCAELSPTLHVSQGLVGAK